MGRRRRAFAVLGSAALAAVLVSYPADGQQLYGAASAKPARAKPLLPDMTPLVASDVHVERGNGWRWLRFETGLANIGRGPLEVRPNDRRRCRGAQRHATQIAYHDVDGSEFFRRSKDTETSRRSAGCMVFHPDHDHWHLEAASRYTLRRPDGKNVIVASKKMSFCLRDSERVPEQYGTFRHGLFYGACSRNSPQGISAGWVDVYQSFLPGQALRLPRRLDNGRYCLQLRVDPQDQLRESDETNNTSVRAFRLRGDAVTVLDRSVCAPRK